MSWLARHPARMELHGRVALTTGGGGPGTGRAVGMRLAAEGASVVVADVDVEGGHETVRRIEAAGGRAAFIRADVTVESDVAAMTAFAGQAYGGLDVLVNSAGGPAAPYFPDAPSDHWGRALDLNLRGPMFAIQHALPSMRLRGGGAVVNIASVAGLGTMRSTPIEYAVAKAGLIRLTAVLGPLAARDGVRVNCVVPDWIATPETTAYAASLDAVGRAEVHMPDQMTPPEQIAGEVVRFVKDDSLIGRVLVCWCEAPWALVAPDDVGYGRSEAAATDRFGAAG